MAPEEQLTWGDDALGVGLAWSEESAPRLASVRAGGLEPTMPQGRPLLEVVTVGDGHSPSSDRLVQSALGAPAPTPGTARTWCRAGGSWSSASPTR